MGMDVYGQAPRTETGRYFRRGVSGWPPLADFILVHCADEVSACRNWYTNDADGLDDRDAVRLADRLMALVEDGTADSWVRRRDAKLSALPDEPCRFCDGTGIRSDAVGVEAGFPLRPADDLDGNGRPNPRAGQIGWCNACYGAGARRPPSTERGLSVEDIAEFAAFCRDSGGFQIC